MRKILLWAVAGIVCVGRVLKGGEIKGFEKSPLSTEQVAYMHLEEGVRVAMIAPPAGEFDGGKSTLVVIYSTPNGNSIEQTLGCKLEKGMDWHFAIQQVAAQIRKLRSIDKAENIVLACVEADGKSWPAWRSAHASQAGEMIRRLESTILKKIPGDKTRLALMGHSGGGSFIIGYLNAYEHLPRDLERIVFLDGDYAYSEEEHHGQKLNEWLNSGGMQAGLDPSMLKPKRLIVVAYDDRHITLNGKPVLKNPDGGTYGSTHRMIDWFSKQMEISQDKIGEFDHYSGLEGRLQFFIHPNPKNEILHTRLVEMNGVLMGLTLGTSMEKGWGEFWGPHGYDEYVQAKPFEFGTEARPSSRLQIPPRAASAPGGMELLKSIAALPRDQEEKAIVEQVLAGNVPEFEMKFKAIEVSAKDPAGVEHRGVYYVMPDYLAVGSDGDFVRVPLTPLPAQAIADKLRCVLTTRKMADDIYRKAEVKLDPRPMTEKREAVETFIEHNRIIEEQRKGQKLGLLVAGIKKDVVISNRLKEKPGRVAIYGWHTLDGKPIQGLVIVHGQGYVDYSHGVRLVAGRMLVDGKEMNVGDVLKDPNLCALVSDEGPIDVKYPSAK